jgi:hypothetical protein
MRVWALAAAAILMLGLGIGLAYLGRPYPPGPGVRWDNLERIELGMSMAEVEAILGRSFDQSYFAREARAITPPDTRLSTVWIGVECQVWVYLGPDWRVIGREGIGPPPPSWGDRVRSRLGV